MPQLLQAEYDWHTVIETDAAIDRRCLEMGMEELMRAMAQKEVQNQENKKKITLLYISSISCFANMGTK